MRELGIIYWIILILFTVIFGVQSVGARDPGTVYGFLTCLALIAVTLILRAYGKKLVARDQEIELRRQLDKKL